MTHPLLRLVLVALVVGAVAALPGRAHPTSDSLSSPDATVYVDGLACPFCAYGLEKKLDQLDAIRAMEVQVERSRILVAFREGQRASETALRRAVEKAGFAARKITFAGEAPSADTAS